MRSGERSEQPEASGHRAAAPAFVPPPYPYDRLRTLHETASELHESVVDLSIGTPVDDPPSVVLEALAGSGAERGYPPSVGTMALREAASDWFDRRLGVTIDAEHIAACVGSKEFVAGLPHWLRLRRPDKDTVLYPAISYPSYAMGATLAGCRAVPVGVDEHWRLDVSSIDPADAARALCLWCNTPANPTGAIDDLGAIAAWGRSHDVPVISDECYVEFTWAGPDRGENPPGSSILEHGADGVLAVHSLSKRSNLAGVRVGLYAGDADLVHYLSELRKHAGFMVPGPAQAAGVAALGDQRHVERQRQRYHSRLVRMSKVLESLGASAPLPEGGFYLWVPAPDGDAWEFADFLARRLGVVVSPGEFYSAQTSDHVRLAMVCTDADLDTVEERARQR